MLRAVGLILCCTIGAQAAFAAWHEHWTATSTAAMSITGDVTLYDDRIVFAGGKSLHFVRLHNIGYADGGGEPSVPATVYRITKPDDPPLIRGNRVCGMGPVTYIVIWHVKPAMPGMAEGRAFAAFTGQAEPVSGGAGHCASLYYEIGR